LAIYDIFISYSSKDRPWAKKLYEDLHARYPSLHIFWDRDSIPAGESWRGELQSSLRNSKHMAMFWSSNAAASNEVSVEISDFNAYRGVTPLLEGSERRGFYIPLEGDRGGGVGDYQGFPDFKNIYKPVDANLGLDGLNATQGQQDWDRMIRMIGDAVSRADQAQKVTIVVAATEIDSVVGLLDHTHDKIRKLGEITLDAFLAGFRLQWADVRGRYGASALDWRPTGDRTIVELLEGVRVRVNAKLEEPDRFSWKFVDLTSGEGIDLVPKLHKQPSVVVLDPVSLYDPDFSRAMQGLKRYVLERQSVILALSPNLRNDEDVYGKCLRELSVPLFDDYFIPEIPPIGEFAARWMPEVQLESQIDPLVRARIRDLRIARDLAAGKATTGYR